MKTSRIILTAGLLLCAVGVSQAQNPVTFRVNMSNLVESAAFDPNTQTVEVRGDTIGWGPGIVMTPTVDTNIYEVTYDYTAGPVGSIHEAKFWYGNPGDNWESINNRQLKLAGGAQIMPTDLFNVNTWPVPTNKVTFQVDMTAQVRFGKFTNDAEGSYVRVSGNFNGWGDSVNFTHDPNAPGSASNIYRGTLDVTGFPGSYPGEYKFRSPIGNTYEDINNRPSFQLTGEPEQILPLVNYNNQSASDLLSQLVMVTFTLHLTNGTPDVNGDPFQQGGYHVYINGDWLPWWTWVGNGGTPPSYCEMTNTPGDPETYRQSFVIPVGNSVAITYKYSFEGFDDEAGFGTNHLRYIRTLTPYSFPVDEFGQNPPLTEQSFGNLAVSATSGSTVPVTWLGRPGVTLQSRTSLTSGDWNNLPGTDATSSTNWPNAGSEQYFRLFHP